MARRYSLGKILDEGLAGLGKVVAHSDAVARIQLELLLFGGLELDAEPPDRLARKAVRQHVRPGWNVGRQCPTPEGSRGAPGTTADGVRLSRDNEGCVALRQLALATRTGAASEIVPRVC